jgi:DhnA family fructose-bisphosphate aldolase class Ia
VIQAKFSLVEGVPGAAVVAAGGARTSESEGEDEDEEAVDRRNVRGVDGLSSGRRFQDPPFQAGRPGSIADGGLVTICTHRDEPSSPVQRPS